MPKVGKQKFPYTSGGVQKAQKHAKETGQKVDMSEYKRGGSPRTSTRTVKPNIGKPKPMSGGRGRSYAATKHAKGIAEARHKANLPAARTQSRIAQRTIPKSVYAKSVANRPAWAVKGLSGGRGRPDAAYKHEKGIGTHKLSSADEKWYAERKGNKPLAKLGINKKKGGAVKKKYHHGGRVMAGQKKPKKC